MVDPVPTPSISWSPVDPFGRLPVELYPEPPGWLLPFTMTLTGLATVAVMVMIVMWVMSRRKAPAGIPRAKTQEWVSLTDFEPPRDKRGLRSPKVARKDDD